MKIAAIFGFLGVALGAFGAHYFAFPPYEDGIWKTASLYHLVHAVMAFVSFSLGRKKAGLIFLLGIVFFSGSLYLLAITKIKVLGAITPIGGTLFLVGWVMMASSKGK